jgi:hypothetical protein
MKNAKDYDLARTHLKESEEGDEAWLWVSKRDHPWKIVQVRHATELNKN